VLSRLLGLAAAMLTVGALLVPATADAGTAAAPAGSVTPAGSAAGTPRVGQCRAMSWTVMQGMNDTSRTVPCAKRHTAKVVAVVQLNPNVLDTLIDVAGPACEHATRKAFAGSPLARFRTLWDTGYFVPTDAQQAAGAHWAECVVAIDSPARKQLMPLPRKLHYPLVKGKQPLAALSCHNAHFVAVSCAQPHVYRPYGGFTVPQRSYPTPARLQALGRRCGAITHQQHWAANWPSATAWSQGLRVILCSVRDRH
jgi:hypothetical protein